MTDPKGEKPESDHPHEEDLPFELHEDQEGLPAADEENLPEALSLNASTEDFHFSGPAEELDFTEPSDFAFPTEQSPGGTVEHSGELAAAEPREAEGFFGAGEVADVGSALPEEATIEPALAGEGIADVEIAEETEGKKSKPKVELPAWVRTAEWVLVGVLAVAALLAVIVSAFWVEKSPKQVTLTLNIACPLMLALIPYALWRSMARWVTPSASASIRLCWR